MVHGFGGSTWSWEKNTPVLASSGFNVIAVDVPPFGYSGKNPDFNQSVDSRAELTWRLLNSIRPGQIWHLVGHSMGGGIIQAMAILNPGQVEKVVFTDPALFSNLSNTDKKQRSLLSFRPFQPIAAGLGRAILVRPAKIRKMLESSYGRQPDAIDVQEYYKALRQKGFALALIRSSAESRPITPLEGKSFNKPAIAIWGDHDTWVPLEQMKPLLEHLPTVEVIVIEGAGHLPMATHPELFNNEVLRFLR
jgi:pimeloyl-ACP methyl ester carboxylesterase